MLPPEARLARRRQTLITCNQEAKAGLVLDPKKFRSKLPRQRLIGETTRRRKTYQNLGQFTKKQFLATREAPLPKAVRRETRFGCFVLGRLLSFAPDAYEQYCQKHQTTPDLDELGASLKASNGTLKKFMHLPHFTNRVAEERFGLRDYRSGFRAHNFKFEPGEGDLPVFVPDDGLFAVTAATPAYAGSLPPHWQRCMAARLITEAIWPAMVDLAVQTPEVFARDLGIT